MVVVVPFPTPQKNQHRAALSLFAYKNPIDKNVAKADIGKS